MRMRKLLAALGAAGMLLAGTAACASDETIEETGQPETGSDTGEGAPPEGGVGEEGVEEEGPIGDTPIDG